MKNIDEALKLEGQKTVANLVANLPNETPCMVWRSGLNEALKAQAARVQRRRRFFFMARPMLGLAAACALAVIVFVHPAVNRTSDPTMRPDAAVASNSPMEQALVNLHVDDLRDMDVAGAGLNPNDPVVDQGAPSTSIDDSEADLEL